MIKLTQNLLKELFNYRNGNLYWALSRRRIKIGNEAGCITTDGYRIIKINGKNYFTHRLIYLYHHGYLPEFIDHIDRNPTNNKIENLREITLSQNQWNRKKNNSHNTKLTSSIYKGVTWFKRDQKWKAQIRFGNKNKHLGLFTNEIDAAIAYNTTAIKYFGEFACLNF